MQLESRSQWRWDQGIFSNCEFEFSHNQTSRDLQVFYTAQLDTTKLPEELRGDLGYDYVVWYANQILNGKETKCLTSSGTGQNDDAVSEFYFKAFSMHCLCKR